MNLRAQIHIKGAQRDSGAGAENAHVTSAAASRQLADGYDKTFSDLLQMEIANLPGALSVA